MRRCALCGSPVAPGVRICPNDGADEKSFRDVRLELNTLGVVFRIEGCPFEGTRAWARTHLSSILDPEGQPVHKYFFPDRPMFAIAERDGGFWATSALSPAPEGNHFRLNGSPMTGSGARLDDGAVLELWSQRRRAVIVAIKVRLASF